MSVSRRTFLKLGASGASGAALASAASLLPEGLDGLDRFGAANSLEFPDQWIQSVCAACPSACPVLLRRIEGKIVGVRPLDGKPCARAYAIPQELYHPDRVLSARKRRRGENSWQSLSRQAALEQLAELLRLSGSRTAFVFREDAGLSFVLFRALAKALRAGFTGVSEWTPGQLGTDALAAATGWSSWRPDLAQAGGVASFGLDWLQAYPDPASAQRAFAALRVSNSPIVSIGPRLDRTAMKSNQWLACRPGFEPLVALALAHCVLKEGRYDHASCDGADGFQEFAAALRAFDLPGAVQEIGAPARRIEELARLLTSRQFVCIGPRRRFEDQWAVTLLNALLGRINKPGGWVPVPDVGLRELDSGAAQNAEILPDLIVRNDGAAPEGRIDTIVLVGANPAFVSPSPQRWHKAFEAVSNVVCVSTFLDETAALGDFVLPLALPAERSETYLHARLADGAVQPMRVEPARIPPAGVFSPEDLVFELARRLGLVGDAFPWRDSREAAASVSTREPNPKAFGFRSPAWTPPVFSGDGYHLLFETPGTLPRMEGGHLPYLLTTVGPHLREWWTTWVEVNPETAAHLGLRDRDLVTLESEAGAIRARVRLFAGVGSGALGVPLGLGHKSGTFAQIEGGNPAELVAFRTDELAAVPLWDFQKVRIRKA